MAQTFGSADIVRDVRAKEVAIRFGFSDPTRGNVIKTGVGICGKCTLMKAEIKYFTDDYTTHTEQFATYDAVANISYFVE